MPELHQTAEGSGIWDLDLDLEGKMILWGNFQKEITETCAVIGFEKTGKDKDMKNFERESALAHVGSFFKVSASDTAHGFPSCCALPRLI